jgi:hypothetical protein
MSESPSAPTSATPTEAAATCARCGRTLTGDDRVDADDRAFCRSCHETLRQQLEQVVDAMSTDINYPMAFVGAVLGGAAGVLLWWGFTVLTKISFGLIAVAIGFAVGWGTTRFAGGKRSRGLQVLSAAVALASFFVATYLVNASFINKTLAERGDGRRIPMFTADPTLFARVAALGFGLMDLVFLAIVLWQAWKMPAPVRLPDRPDA